MPQTMRHIKRICYIVAILALCTTRLSASSLSSSNYTLSMPRIVSSGGSADSSNYSIENAWIGGAFGGVSESPNYTLYAGCFFDRLAIVVNSANWSVGIIKPGSYKITCRDIESGIDERIIIRNDGNACITYSLRATDITGKKWYACDTTNGNDDINKYIMSGIFTDLELAEVNESNFGEEDIITETLQPADGIKFASMTSTENGLAVRPDETRALWLKFDAPKADTQLGQDRKHIEHNICIIIEATKAETD